LHAICSGSPRHCPSNKSVVVGSMQHFLELSKLLPFRRHARRKCIGFSPSGCLFVSTACAEPAVNKHCDNYNTLLRVDRQNTISTTHEIPSGYARKSRSTIGRDCGGRTAGSDTRANMMHYQRWMRHRLAPQYLPL
jgi:hypothetical protein